MCWVIVQVATGWWMRAAKMKAVKSTWKMHHSLPHSSASPSAWVSRLIKSVAIYVSILEWPAPRCASVCECGVTCKSSEHDGSSFPPVHLYSAFLSMLTILLNFNLVAMSNGVSPSWGEKNRRSEPAGGVQGSLGTSTYTVANVDIGVLLQQQGHQTPTLSLADVVKCCIPLLTPKHMSSISTTLLQLIWTKNVL